MHASDLHASPVSAPAAERPTDVYFEAIVSAEADGVARPHELEVLEADRPRWIVVLDRLLWDTEDQLARIRTLDTPEREQIVADFRAERVRLAAALERVGGRPVPLDDDPEDAHDADRRRTERPDRERNGNREPDPADGRTTAVPDDRVVDPVGVLQVSWQTGTVIAWREEPTGAAATTDADEHADPLDLKQLLANASAPASPWSEHPGVPTGPNGRRNPAVVAPLGDILGWLAAIGAEPTATEIGSTLRWLGKVTALGVRLTAQGRMVPQVRQEKRQGPAGEFSVRWTPALVDPDELAALAAAVPPGITGSGKLLGPQQAQQLVAAALADVVDVICRTAAQRLDVPAAPPRVRTVGDVAETVLARLNGTPFEAPTSAGSEVAARLERWARPITSGGKVRLIVQLDPPDEGNAWNLTVLASGVERQPVLVDRALVAPSDGHRREATNALARLERLLPALRRPGHHRRGQVVLSADEAWQLMSELGPRLVAAGFDVRVPELSRRRPVATLRLEAAEGRESVVGIHQLTAVRWSVTFGDVELDAAEITRLAREARPLIRSQGRWVALDKADLAEAAAALAERAHLTELSGAAMLRHALGLEGTPLAGGVALAGNSWAHDLIEAAAAVKSEPLAPPTGFAGTLRTYQAEALAWLGLLERAGLGGCLALDMGLGKTPTVLAHLAQRVGSGPKLVVAPPAVVGNWAAEAARFVPGVRVLVHHGANRASTEELVAEASAADILLTTYATAVRDVEALSAVAWDALVLDEAQLIKNATTDTARQLRRIGARTRVALTGTPVENGLGDLWSILDFTNPGLVGPRAQFVAQLSRNEEGRGAGEAALRALNGLLVFRRTKAEPDIAAELPDRIDQLDHCAMTTEQIGLYQAVLDSLVRDLAGAGEPGADSEYVRAGEPGKGRVLAAITALKQICNHPAAYHGADIEGDVRGLEGRSGKLARLEEIIEGVFAADEKVLVFTHFAEWGQRLAEHLTTRFETPIECYHGGLSRTARDRMIEEFQAAPGAGALILSLKAGGTGLNLTAASHVVLYDRWWNPAVEDQARDRAWRIGQTRTVVCHRLVCPGTVDERVEEVVEGKRKVADLVLPKSSSLDDLDTDQLRKVLGIGSAMIVAEEAPEGEPDAGDDPGERSGDRVLQTEGASA